LRRRRLFERGDDRRQHTRGGGARAGQDVAHMRCFAMRLLLREREQFKAYAFGQFRQHAERLDRAAACAADAEHQHLHVVERGRQRHHAVVRDVGAGEIGEPAKCLRERQAFRSVTLQRPRRDREQGLQHATCEDQHRGGPRFPRDMRFGTHDHQQDQAGQPHAGHMRIERNQHSRTESPQRGGEQQRHRPLSEYRSRERRDAGGQCGQQHPAQAQAVRPRLVGEHGVERTG